MTSFKIRLQRFTRTLPVKKFISNILITDNVLLTQPSYEVCLYINKISHYQLMRFILQDGMQIKTEKAGNLITAHGKICFTKVYGIECNT